MAQTERIIGFRITALREFRDAAVLFVTQRAFIEKSRARAIVDAEVPINVYARGITAGLLATLPFTAVPVRVRLGLNVISTSNFKLELPLITGATLQLATTDVAVVPDSYEAYWQSFSQKGLIRFIRFTGADPDFSSADFSASDFLV